MDSFYFSPFHSQVKKTIGKDQWCGYVNNYNIVTTEAAVMTQRSVRFI